MYGDHNWYTALRYWHIDTCDQVTLMLIDKGYYDYDYEPAPPRAKKTDIKKAREKFRGFFSHTKFYNNTDKQETAIDALSRVQREANEQHKSKDNG